MRSIFNKNWNTIGGSMPSSSLLSSSSQLQANNAALSASYGRLRCSTLFVMVTWAVGNIWLIFLSEVAMKRSLRADPLGAVKKAIMPGSLVKDSHLDSLSSSLLSDPARPRRRRHKLPKQEPPPEPPNEPAPPKKSFKEQVVYTPSSAEAYVMQNKEVLGLTNETDMSPTCPLWTNTTTTTTTTDPWYDQLQQYLTELDDYNRRIREFPSALQDIRQRLFPTDPEEQSRTTQAERYDTVCSSLELHPDGLPGIFSNSNSLLSHSNVYGYMEPLLPPLRHPRYCNPLTGQPDAQYLMHLGYMIHDFAHMCRLLKPHSRIIFMDIGASFEFHSNPNFADYEHTPALYHVALFRKFGFWFDHIYAYEVAQIPAERVYQKLPDYLQASYHWINVGVSADPNHPMHPLSMLLKHYNADDLILIKLDIDNAPIEVPLSQQLLQDDRYAPLIDHFYFEHHVRLHELAYYWGPGMLGSVTDSLDLFTGLRQKQGIPAHYWP